MYTPGKAVPHFPGSDIPTKSSFEMNKKNQHNCKTLAGWPDPKSCGQWS